MQLSSAPRPGKATEQSSGGGNRQSCSEECLKAASKSVSDAFPDAGCFSIRLCVVLCASSVPRRRVHGGCKCQTQEAALRTGLEGIRTVQLAYAPTAAARLHWGWPAGRQTARPPGQTLRQDVNSTSRRTSSSSLAICAAQSRRGWCGRRPQGP